MLHYYRNKKLKNDHIDKNNKKINKNMLSFYTNKQ